MSLPKHFLEVLACPTCKQSLKETKVGLKCKACKITYPLVDGIPDFLV